MANPRCELIDLYRDAVLRMGDTGWHWFRYHFQVWPPHSFAQSLLTTCAALDRKMPGLGRELLMDIAGIGGREKHRPHYDQLMQKLAELLVLGRLLELPWPKGSTFRHEPAGAPGGKRPELLVTTCQGSFVFEVKAPSLLEHQLRRSSNETQLPARVIPLDLANGLFGSSGITLPRDNPVKDFLVSANAKFEPFKKYENAVGILVIVWDDFILEPITALIHEHSGLLTVNSFARDEHGNPLEFPNVDGIVLVRHLMYFQNAAGDLPLVERAHAFDFGDDNALPNVYIPTEGGSSLPAFLVEGLRARQLDDPFLQMAAEYRPTDLVWWFNT